jgi:hypothetical protein
MEYVRADLEGCEWYSAWITTITLVAIGRQWVCQASLSQITSGYGVLTLFLPEMKLKELQPRGRLSSILGPVLGRSGCHLRCTANKPKKKKVYKVACGPLDCGLLPAVLDELEYEEASSSRGLS